MLHRMFRPFVILAFVSAASAASADDGLLRCSEDTPRGQCRLQWEILDPMVTRVWIQRVSPETGTWTDVGAPTSHGRDQSAKTFGGGQLLRVLGCTDSSRRTCTSTNVVWTPIWIDDSAKIPSTVTLKDGVVYGVSKNAELIDQVLQYNFYKLHLLVTVAGDISTFPAMRKANPEMTTFEDTVQANVYSLYMGFRARHSAGNFLPAK